jgi:hypothetical protein
LAATEAAALRHEPALELRTSIDFQAVEKISREHRAQLVQLVASIVVEALVDRPRHFDCID